MSWFSSLFKPGHGRRVLEFSAGQQQILDEWRQLPPINLQCSHRQARYVVVDVETSGLNMKKDRLISIGALAVENSRINFKDAFQVVLRQKEASTRENILIHGIGGSAQTEGEEPVEALLSFLQYIGNSPLVAYHAFFDQSMIDKALKTYIGHELGRPWIDLAWVLPDFFPNRADTTLPLDDWLQFFQIENILRHNAVSDAFATAKLLQVAFAAGVHRGAETPASFIEIEKARRWMFESR